MTREPILIFIFATLAALCFWRFCVANGFLPFGEVIHIVRESARVLWQDCWILYAFLILALASALLQESNNALGEYLLRRHRPELFPEMVFERPFSLSHSMYRAWAVTWRTASEWLSPSLPQTWSTWLPAILFLRFRVQIRECFFRTAAVTGPTQHLLWVVIWIGIITSFVIVPAPFILTVMTMQSTPPSSLNALIVTVLIPVFLLTIGVSTLLLCGVIGAVRSAPGSRPHQLLDVEAEVFHRLLIYSVVVSLVFITLTMLCTNILRVLPVHWPRWVVDVQHLGLTCLIPALVAFLFPAPVFIVLSNVKPQDVVRVCWSFWKAHWRILITLVFLWLTTAFGFAFVRHASQWLAEGSGWVILPRIVFDLAGAAASAFSLVTVVRLLNRLGALRGRSASLPATQ